MSSWGGPGLTQREKYAEADAQSNPLVMVPSIRRCTPDSPHWAREKPFEMGTMWFYPRVGWAWQETDSAAAAPERELTVGYYWPLLQPADD